MALPTGPSRHGRLHSCVKTAFTGAKLEIHVCFLFCNFRRTKSPKPCIGARALLKVNCDGAFDRRTGTGGWGSG